MLDVILSQVATGLVLGGLYVLIAIGLSIIFGLLGIVNFAHGNFFALGAYFALTLYKYFGWPGGAAGTAAGRRGRHGGGTDADPPALRQGTADQPDRHLRAGVDDRGAAAADLGRHRPALQPAAIPVGHLSSGDRC